MAFENLGTILDCAAEQSVINNMSKPQSIELIFLIFKIYLESKTQGVQLQTFYLYFSIWMI